MSKLADVIERTKETLMVQINDGKAVDVGRGTEEFFDLSHIDYIRALTSLVEEDKVKIFFVYVTRDNKDVGMKVITPMDWSYRDVLAKHHEIVDFRHQIKPLKELKEKLYDIYIDGLSNTSGFYAGEADETGLLAVYNAGIAAGKLEKE